MSNKLLLKFRMTRAQVNAELQRTGRQAERTSAGFVAPNYGLRLADGSVLCFDGGADSLVRLETTHGVVGIEAA